MVHVRLWPVLAVTAATLAVAAPAIASAPSTLTVTGQNPNPSTVGQSVTLTATMTTGAAGCTGTVTFTDGGVPNLCAASLTGLASPYSASCPATFATAGARNVQASYGGSVGCIAALSAGVTQTVNAAPVPTLGEWAMILLAGVLLLGGTSVLARRARRLA